MSFRAARVYCKTCEEYHVVDGPDIETLDIHEDEMGQDVITFVCRICFFQQESLVRMF